MTETESKDADSAAVAADAAAAAGVRARQVRLVYDQALGGLLASLLLAGTFAWVAHAVVPPPLWMAWLGALGGAIGLRLVLLASYRIIQSVDLRPERWATLFALVSVVSGAVWGAGGFLVARYGGAAEHVVLVATLTGLAAIALSTKASLFLAFLAYMLPALLPTAGWFALRSDPNVMLAGLLLLLMVAIVIVAGYSLERRIWRSFSLGLQNVDLVRRLASAKHEAETTTRRYERANQALKSQVVERRAAEERLERSRAELNNILQDLQDVFFRVDMEGRFERVSAAIEPLLGCRSDALVGRSMDQILVGEATFQTLIDALETRFGVLQGYETTLRHSDGTTVWGSINAHYYRDSQNEIKGVEGTIRDVTLRKRAEEALFQAKERVEVTLKSIGDAVITTDMGGHIDYMNPVAEEFTGSSLDQATGRALEQVVTLVDEGTGEALDNPIEQCLEEGRRIDLPGNALLITQVTGHRRAVEITVAPIRGSSGDAIGVVMVLHDVSELRGLARQMTYRASHDALTGLLNRRGFEDVLTQTLKELHHSDSEHALCYIDLDKFKIVNDTCGHQAGDDLLKQLSAQFESCVRDSDVLARLGGDEFAVLLRWCPLQKARDIAESLRGVTESFRFVWEDQIFRIGASIGIVPLTAQSGNLGDVLNAADSACYVAKERGRNRIHVFQVGDEEVVEQHGHGHWVRQLRKALKHEGFELHLQRAMALRAGQSACGELLVRMRGDDNESVLPHRFFTVAERHHLMPEIDLWVVRQAVEVIAGEEHPLDAAEARYSINLSAQTLGDDGALKAIEQVIERAHLPPGRLYVELPESGVLANLARAETTAQRFAELGCGVAVDDVGGNLTTVAYLKRLPVDVVKLEPAYAYHLSDPVNRAAASFLVEVAHIVGASAVIKGVEDEDTLERTRALNAEYAQGFYVNRPVGPV